MNKEKTEQNFLTHLLRYFSTDINTIAGGIPFRRKCLLIEIKVPNNKL